MWVIDVDDLEIYGNFFLWLWVKIWYNLKYCGRIGYFRWVKILFLMLFGIFIFGENDKLGI